MKKKTPRKAISEKRLHGVFYKWVYEKNKSREVEKVVREFLAYFNKHKEDDLGFDN